MRLWILVLLGAGILCIPALLNGVPFFYFDTVAYLNRPALAIDFLARALGLGAGPSPAESVVPVQPHSVLARTAAGEAHTVVGGRSIYYGLLAYGSYATGQFLILVAVQALLTSWLLALLVLRVLAWPAAAFLAIVAAGTALTPLGFFTGLAMPDFLAPLVVLATGLLVCAWERLAAVERAGLFLVAAFAMTAHNSHLMLGAALLAVLLAARLAPSLRRRLSGRGAGAIAAAVVLALVAEGAFTLAVRLATGQESIARPHLTAHLVDGLPEGGPGVRFLDETCPGSGPGSDFVLCEYRDQLPMFWTDFLFDREDGIFTAVDAETQRALADEHTRFALAVLRHDPVGTATFLGAAWIRQLGLVGIDTVPIDARRQRTLETSFPPDLVRATEASPLYTRPGLLHAATSASYVVMLLALAALAQSSWRLQQRPPGNPGWRADAGDEDDPALLLVLVLLAGLLLNAAICGMLASPYPRFQARIIWLLPLAAVVAAHAAQRLGAARPLFRKGLTSDAQG